MEVRGEIVIDGPTTSTGTRFGSIDHGFGSSTLPYLIPCLLQTVLSNYGLRHGRVLRLAPPPRGNRLFDCIAGVRQSVERREFRSK